MKKLLFILAVLFTFTVNAQVTRPRSASVVNFGDSISYYVQNNTIMGNTTLRPAAVPRLTDTVYAPYSAPFSVIDAMIGPANEKIGQTLQMFDGTFTPFFFYSDGVNWITSQLAYLTNTAYSLYFTDSIYHDWHGWSTYDEMWPGDSIPASTDTGYVTIYVSNYTEGVGIPITIYDVLGNDYQTDTTFARHWCTVDGEDPFWYDWERTLVDDTTTFMIVVDRTKIDWDADPYVVGQFEFSYPRGYSEGGPPSEPYPGKSFAIKIMSDLQ
jgi:hypothetical protein